MCVPSSNSSRSRDGNRGSRGVPGGTIASRIGERSNRRGCLSLSSQVSNSNQEVEQQNQDQCPNREEIREEEDEIEDDVDEDLYERGPALMPDVPREDDKVVLTPHGDRQWRENNVTTFSRSPNGIVGLLIRKNYPGIVNYNGNRIAAHKFCHYRVVPEPTTNSRQQPTSALQKIESKFWLYFKWADTKEVDAKRVLRNVIKHLLPSAFYEARLQSIVTYHRHVLKVNITRSEASKLYPSVEEYMKAIPYWFATCPDAWKKLAQLWNTDEWIAKSRAGRTRKAKKLRIHRQGSASAARYQKNLEKKLKRSVFEIEAYLTARKEKDAHYADQDAQDAVMRYSAVCEEMHGGTWQEAWSLSFWRWNDQYTGRSKCSASI